MQLRKPKADKEAIEREQFVAALRSAQREYDVAVSCFGEAVEPEIIDESIFLMEAARKKYDYFLRRIRAADERASHFRRP
ncbi:MAG: DUF2508 family protein [Bacillota bacterium]